MNSCQSVIKPRHLFAGFLLLLVALGSIFPITDNDVWWHLATGETVVRLGSIPTRDIYSFTIYGKPWLTFEWLSQVVLYVVYASSGLIGLSIFKASVAVIIFILMLMRARSRGASILVGWPVFALSFIAMRDGLRERPQLFTYFFAALYPLILNARDRRWWYCVPLLQVLWVNMHGPAAIVGFGVAAIYAAFAVDRPLRHRAGLAAATFAAMFVNPHGYGIFGYFITFFHEGFNRLILEYRPPQLSLPYLPYFLLLVFSLLTLPKVYRKNKADFPVLLIAAAASLMAIRNIPLFLILSMPIAVAAVALPKAKDFSGAVQALAAGAVLFVAFGGIAKAADVTHKYPFGTGDRYRARYAVEFIRSNHIKGNLFNDYDFGGYLIWKLFPEKKVFVDGRLVEYGADFVERTFYYWKQPIWDSFEKTYGITAAIIPQERYYNAWYLDARTDWALVWWDDAALVYLKNTAENRDIIARNAYRYVRPNSPRQDYLRSCPRDAVNAELERSIAGSPQSQRARLMLRYVAQKAKPSL